MDEQRGDQFTTGGRTQVGTQEGIVAELARALLISVEKIRKAAERCSGMKALRQVLECYLFAKNSPDKFPPDRLYTR